MVFFLVNIVLVCSNIVYGEEVSLIFGGDVSFTGISRYTKENGRCSYNESFEVIRKYFSVADEVIVNMENPVTNQKDLDSLPTYKDKNIHLVAEEETLQSLK